jgi:hypothetical protein
VQLQGIPVGLSPEQATLTTMSRLESGHSLLRCGRLLCHQVGDDPELQPPLLVRALEFQICHTVKIAHIMKNKFAVLQADKAIGGIPLAALRDQMLDAQPCQPRSLDAVKRRRITALL